MTCKKTNSPNIASRAGLDRRKVYRRSWSATEHLLSPGGDGIVVHSKCMSEGTTFVKNIAETF